MRWTQRRADHRHERHRNGEPWSLPEHAAQQHGRKARSIVSQAAGCVDLRLHQTTLYTSIYRFDRDMLVNHHVLGLPAAHAPVMHLRQLESGDLFMTYTDTFEKVWLDAAPAWPREAVA